MVGAEAGAVGTGSRFEFRVGRRPQALRVGFDDGGLLTRGFHIFVGY